MGWLGIQITLSGPVPPSASVLGQALARLGHRIRASALLVEWTGDPALRAALFEHAATHGVPVYLWHSLLADVPGVDDAQRVRDALGRIVPPWPTEGPGQGFRFVCPTNPAAQARVLAVLEERYAGAPYAGVFLDRVRLPSFANGLAGVCSCFCSACVQAALAEGLDLPQMAGTPATLLRGGVPWSPPPSLRMASSPAAWLTHWPWLGAWIAFRSRCVAAVVRAAASVVRARGGALGLDLFSPSLSPWVGQDYPLLATTTDWIKPMTYVSAWGPAGLPLELAALLAGVETAWPSAARDLGPFLGLPTLPDRQLLHTEGLPEAVIAHEVARACTAVAQAPDTLLSEGHGGDQRAGARAGAQHGGASADPARPAPPPPPIYAGIEANAIAGVCTVTPAQVLSRARHALRSGAGGLVASWDLLAMSDAHLDVLAQAMAEASSVLPRTGAPTP
jgi:hypothetical protein